jgi:hypothetical protein
MSNISEAKQRNLRIDLTRFSSGARGHQAIREPFLRGTAQPLAFSRQSVRAAFLGNPPHRT